VKFPPDWQENSEKQYKDFKKLIKRLLVKDPKKRLGYSETSDGASMIKAQKFFKNVDFDAILKKKMPAPFVPHINKSKLVKL
jgi:serine/threonine protein kinase